MSTNPPTAETSDPPGGAFEHFTVPNDEISVKSVAELIYPLFSIDPPIADRCSLRMAGCTIEPRPILAIEYTPEMAIRSAVKKRLYFGETGELPDETSTSLELASAAPCESIPPWFKSAGYVDRLQQLVVDASESLGQNLGRLETGAQRLRVIWCKQVEGKLQIELGTDTRLIKFAGWAKQFTNGHEICPPFFCPESGKSSYRITADDEGTLTVPAALATCQVSGRRLLETRVSRCSVSDQWVDDRLLWTCPSSGCRLIESMACPCTQCKSLAAPQSTSNGKCLVCASLIRTAKDTPVISELCARYELARRAIRWKTATCDDYAVATCRVGWSCYLFTVAMETMELVQVGKANLFGRQWQSIPIHSIDEA